MGPSIAGCEGGEQKDICEGHWRRPVALLEDMTWDIRIDLKHESKELHEVDTRIEERKRHLACAAR